MKKTVLLLAGLEFFRDGYFSGLFIFLPFIAKDLHLSLTEAGSLPSFIYLIGLLSSIPIHVLVKRLDGMKFLNFCLLLFALTSISLFFTTNFYFIFFCLLFTSVGFSIYGSLAQGLLSKITHASQRGKIVGNIMALGDLAKVIATSSFVFFILHIGWRNLNLFLGLFLCCCFILYELFPTTPIMLQENEHHEKKLSLWKLLSHKEFFYVLLAGGLDMFANISLYFLIPFLLFAKGLTAPQVGIITGTYFLGNMCSRLVFGRLVDRHGSARVFIVSEIFMAIFLILLVNSSFVPLITLFAICLGFITEASDPATVTMTAHIADKLGNFGEVFNIRATVSRAAILISPILLGFIGDHTTITYSFYTIAGAVLLAIVPAYLLIRIDSKA